MIILILCCGLMYILRLAFLHIIYNRHPPTLKLHDPPYTRETQIGIPLQRTRPSQRAIRVKQMKINPIIAHMDASYSSESNDKL